MATRAGNKTAHPGDIVKGPKRRTTTEVEAERAAKAKAKEDRELAKKQNIELTAQFEREDLMEENKLDTTPRPASKQKSSRIDSLPPNSSDIETANVGGAHLGPSDIDEPIDVDDSSAESDLLRPPKKAKASSTSEGKTKVGKKTTGSAASTKATEEKGGKVVVPVAEPPKKIKPKKKTLREEINLTKENEEKQIGALIMLLQGNESEKPLAASELTEVSGDEAPTASAKRGLKRQGGMKDITKPMKDQLEVDESPDQANPSDQKGKNDT
jgi:hypothetical protein